MDKTLFFTNAHRHMYLRLCAEIIILQEANMLTIDGWRIDTTAREARRSDQKKSLSPRAIRLLQVLVEAEGGVLSRQDLLRRVWPNVFVSDESLTQVVSEVRRKLENHTLIETISGAGYRLTKPALRAIDPMQEKTFSFSIGAYAICIEARLCFENGLPGSQRRFVELAAEAAAMAPDYAEARALHALALMKRHIFWSEGEQLLERAMQECTASLRLDPTLAVAHLTDASIRLAWNDVATAVQSLEKAVSLATTDASVHLQAAIFLLSIGDYRSAAALSAKSAALSPRDFGADLLAARVFRYHDPQRGYAFARQALAKVRDVLSIDPVSMRALYALGPLLALLGETQAAKRALETVPECESPLEYYRAIGFAHLGDTTSCLERLDFLGHRGWRHACILDHDDGFRPLKSDQRFGRLKSDLLAA